MRAALPLYHNGARPSGFLIRSYPCPSAFIPVKWLSGNVVRPNRREQSLHFPRFTVYDIRFPISGFFPVSGSFHNSKLRIQNSTLSFRPVLPRFTISGFRFFS
jgi:hypothetical protein